MDRVAEIAREIFKKHPEWKWKLIGTGEMEKDISARAIEFDVFPSLTIQAPRDHKIMEEYRNASIYIMLSRNECFPMTLLEARAAGLPCLAFDCETGPRHIINHNIDGFLIPENNRQEMAEAAIGLIENFEKRKAFGEKARANNQMFSPENILTLWKNLLG
jgi:glycosyltransferase involved in cell wall biosynthesis